MLPKLNLSSLQQYLILKFLLCIAQSMFLTALLLILTMHDITGQSLISIPGVTENPISETHIEKILYAYCLFYFIFSVGFIIIFSFKIPDLKEFYDITGGGSFEPKEVSNSGDANLNSPHLVKQEG